jgi:phosphotriesterase-related protein
MTVIGPVWPDSLGITLPHEHLLAAPPATVDAEPDYRIDDRAAALADAETFSFAGGDTIVDCTPADNGRDLGGLAWVASRVAVRIVATAGFHMERHSAAFIGGRAPEHLAAHLVDELRDGDRDFGVRPGQLKAASSLNEITAIERIAFEAIAIAHRATGVPIITHTEAGTMALEQLDLLGRHGVDPRNVTVAHLDRRYTDRAYLLSVLATGATIGFDQLGKPAHGPDEPKAAVIAELVALGYGERIVISHDIARRSLRPAYGGAPGLSWILDRFLFMLLDAGVPALTVRQLIHDNPARILTIHPPQTPAT